jgi:hypothetical protein
MTVSNVRCPKIAASQIGLLHSAPHLQVLTISRIEVVAKIVPFPSLRSHKSTSTASQLGKNNLPEEEALFLGSSPSSRLFLLFLPEALTTNLGHRVVCHLNLVGPTAREPISPATARRDNVAGRGCLGVRQCPPAFRLRAHMSMAARAVVGGGSDYGAGWKQSDDGSAAGVCGSLTMSG